MNYKQLNLWQKFAVVHAHPASFISSLLGLIWGGYLLWLHRPVYAVLCFAVLLILGWILSFADRSYFIQVKSQLNPFQKLLVYHSHPLNFLLHLLALLAYVAAAWYHSWLYFLVAFSLVLLGHLFPWFQHRKQERMFYLMVDEDVSARESD